MPPSYLGFRLAMGRHSSAVPSTEQDSALAASVAKPVLLRIKAINRVLAAHRGANIESEHSSSAWQRPGHRSLDTDQAKR